MTRRTMDEIAQPAPSDDALSDSVSVPGNVEVTDGAATSDTEVAACVVCAETAVHTCRRCKADLCQAHSYCEEGGTLYYCRACADDIVGVCDVCDALHARPCRECGMKVCEAHQKRVIERWGWGGVPGQGGVTAWFPILRTYCQEHGQNRIDVPRPALRTFTGYDGSSPEW